MHIRWTFLGGYSFLGSLAENANRALALPQVATVLCPGNFGLILGQILINLGPVFFPLKAVALRYWRSRKVREVVPPALVCLP